MVIKYHISPYPALHEPMVVRIWEAESDGVGAEVYSEVLLEKDGAGTPTVGAGHQVINNIVFNGADKVVHIVRLYTNSGTLLHEFFLEPTVDLATVYTPIQFKIGDAGPVTPVAGTDTFISPFLIGIPTSEFLVHRNGQGVLIADTHYTYDPITGSIVLLAGDVFGADEEWTIEFLPSVVSTYVNDSVVGKKFAARQIIAGNIPYSPTHLRKLLCLVGNSIYTFPAGQQVPIGYGFVFQNFGAFGTGNAATIKFLNGDLRWGNTTKNEIILPPYTQGSFIWDGANWDVEYISDSRWINPSTSTPVNTIVDAGVFAITWPAHSAGDVPAGSPNWEIVHNKGITGDYIVFISIKTNDATFRAVNDRTIGNWWHSTVDKPNRFHVGLRELTAEAQNLSIAWMIVKI